MNVIVRQTPPGRTVWTQVGKPLCFHAYVQHNHSIIPVDSDPRAPTIIAIPQDQIISLAQAVNFTCEADGNPPPVYRWYQDGMQVPGANLPNFFIPEISPSNRGNYTCRAINQEGSVESSPGLLTIQGSSLYSLRVLL